MCPRGMSAEATQLPLEDIADGRNEKQKRVCRGSGFN